MSLINPVGRKSLRMRLLVLAIYLLLSIGSVTMVIPFLLMGSMATTSEADFREFKLVQDYWTNDLALFRKVLIDTAKLDASSVWAKNDRWFAPTDVRNEDLKFLADESATGREARAEDLTEFIEKVCPSHLRLPLFVPNQDSPFSARDVFRKWLEAKYVTLRAANLAHGESAEQWSDFPLPEENAFRLPADTVPVKDYRLWVASLPADRVMLYSADADVAAFLKTVEVPGGDRRLTYDAFRKLPGGAPLVRQFFTEKASLRFATVDVNKADPAWRTFLLAEPDRPSDGLSRTMPIEPRRASRWAKFIQQSCPLEALGLDRPEVYWRTFLEKKYGSLASINARFGTSYASLDAIEIPILSLQYSVFLKHKDSIRTAYFTHNFKTVIDFVAIHGNAMSNTVWLIVLTLLSTLTVNPMAAYALSRFKLKESHQILVFLLATMAFPGEVLMIPGFLQIKEFPVAAIVGAIACFAAFLVGNRAISRLRPIPRFLILTVVLVSVSGFVAPTIARAAGFAPSQSLMNTFWALILPGLASGYGIFLLKGFFDSLPPELYEAGLLDGAGEMTMFARITLPLCKPILAVMALGSFTGAYGAFMHAFLVTQDPKMWTLMVFLYEFQQSRSLPMVMASLVLAAVPTLLMFVLCQRVILRGIVIPTYK